LRSIVRFARPGGRVRVYLYWVPERAWHRRVLHAVSAVRRVTVHMPHRVLHALCYPLGAVLWLGVVLPYRVMRRRSRTHAFADSFPLKAYADYPFGVLVNDQFDRFSAPLERRYTRSQVESMLRSAGLEYVAVFANSGWVAEGRVPGAGTIDR
jgi:hypothetical protein